MCRTKFSYYEEDSLLKLKMHYDSLSEKAARAFLAIEFEHLGKGSKSYLSRVFGSSRVTIDKAIREMEKGDYSNNSDRQRSKGGGRKKKNV